MYDYHMHSTVSFDGHDSGLAMAQACAARGLREICFTDHIDYTPQMDMVFDTARYNAEYDHLEVPGLLIRRGMEYGLTPDNAAMLKKDLNRRHFDFVLGSVHMVDGVDIYLEPYWQGKSYDEAIRLHLETTLECVRNHRDFDVLGHLTYISKARSNPTKRLIPYEWYREVYDEILKLLVAKGKGMEINSSGVDRCGDFLPHGEYLRRFKELGGEIVTVGSDAHGAERVGQHMDRACQLAMDIFGHVCTFENRTPIFHKL